MIILQVDLSHGSLRTLVEFQFQEIEIGVGEQNHVYSALWSMHLYVHYKACEESEDDIQHLLVMTLIVGHIAVGQCFEVVLQELQSTVHISTSYKRGHFGYGHTALLGLCAVDIIGQ